MINSGEGVNPTNKEKNAENHMGRIRLSRGNNFF